MNNVHKFALKVGLLLALIFVFFGCSTVGGGNTDTYYVEMGGISVGANNAIQSKWPNLTAQEALKYCHAYRVSGDKYFSAESGVSRAKLEQDAEESVPDEKAALLRELDKNGAFWAYYILDNNDMVYLYVEKE